MLQGSVVSRKQTRFIQRAIGAFALALLIIIAMRLSLVSFRMNDQSMEPGFHASQYVLVNKLAYLFQQPQRGDVIVFHYPFDIHTDFIKRVIGVPGDTIKTTGTSVMVNGQVIHESYISRPYNFDDYVWKLGPDQFFVMGDNRSNSLDSRIWGPLTRSYIVGKVVAIDWPPEAWSSVNTYPSVFAAVHPTK